MVIDISVVNVRAGKEEVFIATFHQAWAKLGRVEGLDRWLLLRGVEKPRQFIFYGEWRSVEDHVALAKQPGYETLLAAIGPYLEGSPEILHYSPSPAPKTGTQTK